MGDSRSRSETQLFSKSSQNSPILSNSIDILETYTMCILFVSHFLSFVNFAKPLGKT